ncbi:hypothetical protein [Spiroplasma endosymbiont of Aspidapion aeneum]|uniref:hypothetical protein n=1 Tax=Spiroplasma endosymbiont of Aspidapion aeneum TaxID=3066276 RepID=UPI00313BFAEA
MSNTLTIILTIIFLFVTFGLCYYIGFKIGENKKILISAWITGTIGTIICATITILLTYFTSFEFIATISAVCWGSFIGIICGLSNFKYRYRNILKLKGKF